jgi:hypothetical protein
MSYAPETFVVQRLLTSPTIATLIDDRIEPSLSSEQTTLPRVVYTAIATDSQINLSGGAGYTFKRFQFDVFAKTIEEVQAIAEAFRNRLHGFRGSITVDAESLFFGLIKLEGERDTPTNPDEGTDQPVYGRSLDYFLSCQESIPSLTA